MTVSRHQELADGLRRTEERIASACASVGRSRSEVTLVVVTKNFPAADIGTLLKLGVRDIGESRDQEARAKLAELAELTGPDGLRPTVHFVGQAQRNKAQSIAGYADVVHSVDRTRLATALDTGARRADRTLNVLIQVDLDPVSDAGRGGAAPDAVAELAGAVAQLHGLRLRGVMAVAPREADPDEAFARLREVATTLQSSQPEADWISAGMSGDLEPAIRHGATHLRVGTAILGSRASHR
jgi:PLP dependent protein